MFYYGSNEDVSDCALLDYHINPSMSLYYLCKIFVVNQIFYSLNILFLFQGNPLWVWLYFGWWSWIRELLSWTALISRPWVYRICGPSCPSYHRTPCSLLEPYGQSRVSNVYHTPLQKQHIDYCYTSIGNQHVLHVCDVDLH